MEALSLNTVTPAITRNRDTNWQLLPLFRLDLHQQADPGRQRIERFIYQRFAHQYGAEINAFLPKLLSAEDDHGISAALGFQLAADAPLFLEQYLDCDIETTLTLVTQTELGRDGIVEIGNLASGRQRATQTLFLLLAQILHDAGFEWVVFTANRSVRSWLAQLQIPAFILREADPARLINKETEWGSYYHDSPVVLAANIEQSFGYINTHPLMSHLLDSYQSQIKRFAASLTQ